MMPNIITGTTATDNMVKSITPYATALVLVGIVAIAIFGRRH